MLFGTQKLEFLPCHSIKDIMKVSITFVVNLIGAADGTSYVLNIIKNKLYRSVTPKLYKTSIICIIDVGTL